MERNSAGGGGAVGRSLGGVATVIWAIVVGALNLKLGYGVWANFLFAFGFAALGIPLVTLAVALILRFFGNCRALLTGFVVGRFFFLLRCFGSIRLAIGRQGRCS